MTQAKKTIFSVTGLVIAIVLFFAINMFSYATFNTLRFDLTENKLYTLSAGTQHILQQIDEPLTLTFYYSKSLSTGLAQINNYGRRIESLLQELQRTANDKVIIQTIDPLPFSEEEDRALSYGLQGAPLNSQGQNFYFGLVGNNAFGDERSIAFFQFDRESFLEYDIAQLIYQLNNPAQPNIGVLSSLPLQGSQMPTFMGASNSAPWGIWNMMDTQFNLELLDFATTDISDDLDVLMLISPQNISESTAYAIDQYVLRGGHVLAFIDTFTQQGGAVSDTDIAVLTPLLESWGFELNPTEVIADRALGKQVWNEQAGRRVLIDYPLWLDLSSSEFNLEDPIISQINTLSLASPSVLTPLANPNTDITPLITTTLEAMPVNIADIPAINVAPETLLLDYQASNTQYILASRITGSIQSAFPAGPPVQDESTDETIDTSPAPLLSSSAHLTQSTQDTNIILVADSEMLEDRFWLNQQNFFGQAIAIPFAANGNFVINALDNLSGNNDLISIRSRGEFAKPFTRIRTMQQQAEMRYLATEQTLLTELEETEAQLQALNDQEVIGEQLILSETQQETLNSFRTRQIEIRGELRDVQYELQRDIQTLSTHIKIIDIGLMPLLVGISGIGVSFYRARKRRKPFTAKSSVPKV